MAPAPSTQPSIRAVIESSYKGGSKRWSTRWHFTPSVDVTDAVFAALADDIDPLLLACFTPRSELVEYVGYNAGSEVPVWSATRSDAGTFDLGTRKHTPLECCSLTRYGTTQRTSRNHPVYLFQYIHDAVIDPDFEDYERLDSDQSANLGELADAWVTGFLIGGSHYKKTGPYGAVAQSALINEYITHRDFP